MDDAGAFPSQPGGSLDAKLEALLADIDTSVNKAEQRAIRNERAAQRGPGDTNKIADDPFAERVTGRHEAEDAVEAVADAIDSGLQDDANPTPDSTPSEAAEAPADDADDAEAEDEWAGDEWAAGETLSDDDTLAADLAAALEAGTSDGVDRSADAAEHESPSADLPEPPPESDPVVEASDEVSPVETVTTDELPEGPANEDPFANVQDDLEPEGIIETPDSFAEPDASETPEPVPSEPNTAEPGAADGETATESQLGEAEPDDPASADATGETESEESTPPVDLDALRAEISGAIDEIRAEADAEIAKGPPPLPDPPPIEEPSSSLEDDLASVGEVAPVEAPEAPAQAEAEPEPSDSGSTSAPSDEIADLDAELASEAEGSVDSLATDPWEGDTDSPDGAVVGVDDEDDDTLPPPAAARGGTEQATEPPVVETTATAAASDQRVAAKTSGPKTYGRWPSIPPKPDWPEAKGKGKALTITKRHALWLLPPVAGWAWHHTKRLAKKVWEATRPTTIKVLEAAHKPLEKLDPKLRSAVGWIGVYTCFLATCLWVFVFFVQKPTMPQTDAVPITLDAPDGVDVAAATE